MSSSSAKYKKIREEIFTLAMNKTDLLFTEEQLNRICPYYFLITESMEIEQCGTSLKNIWPSGGTNNLSGSFIMGQPSLTEINFATLQTVCNKTILLKSKGPDTICLSGRFEFIANCKKLLFIGEPQTSGITANVSVAQQANSFTNDAALSALLHAVAEKKISAEELKELVENFETQKKDLKKSADDFERLSLVASANENGVLFTYPDGRITWANEGFCKLTGFTPDEVIGKTPVELCRGPLTDYDTLKQVFEAFFNGVAFNTEIIYYRKNGSWFWGRSSSQPIKNNDGNVTEFFGIIEDITTSKEQARQIKILSQIAEDNINAVIIADKDGKITWVNKSFTTMTGYTMEEAVGKKPGYLLQGPETDAETIAYLRKQINSGEPFTAEILNYHKNGNKYWLHLQGQPIKNEDGELTGFFALEKDITNEKETERRFRSVLENIGDNVWEHDFKTGITYFSKSNNEILGYQAGELSNNQELWWRSVYKDDLPLLTENDLKYRSGEVNSHKLEYRIVHKDGTVRWVLDRGVVIERDINGLPLKITGTHIDVTHQKNLELELIKAREQAERLGKAKETFLANMSHEIRTPMNAIMGMGNQLAKTNLSEQQAFYLNTINTASDNLLVIINDILDLSKIEAGKLNVEQIGFEPRKVVSHVMQVLMYKAEEKGLQLTNSFCDSRLSPVLIGDPYRLNQILLNLVGNAIKFTEKGSVDMVCTILSETETTQTVQGKITDTGIGIEKIFLEKLFDKFSQEYESVTRKFGGTGLGMSICKQLIELMGGTIEVTSEKGKGTTVTFTVELKKGSQADLPVITTAEISGGFLTNKKILVADDNEMNRLVAGQILESYGATIIEAVNGKDAVAVTEKHLPDLILMDIQMPLMNGYDAVIAIRKSGNQVPVIALTANTVKGENNKCFEAGMNDYITKPFKEEAFLKIIAHWIKAEAIIEKKQIVTAPVQTTAALYNLSALEAISHGNAAFIEKMVAIFCEQTPEIVSQMQQEYAAGQLDKMGALAHKLKPSIDNLNITTLKDVIRAVEKAGKENTNLPQLPGLLQQTTEITAAVIKQMQTLKLNTAI